MNSAALSSAMRALIIAEPAIGAIDGPALTKLCDAIAQAVVTHIQTTGVVNAVGTAPPGGGPVAVIGTVT